MNVENQNIKFYFGEDPNYIQIGNGYLDLDKEIKEADETNFTNDVNIRQLNNGLACVFQEGLLSTSSALDIKNKKYLGTLSTCVRLLTHKDGIYEPILITLMYQKRVLLIIEAHVY